MNTALPLCNTRPDSRNAEADNSLTVRHLGLQPYEPVWRAMQAFTDARDERTADELWLLQHPPVFTQGQAGKAEHVLAAGNIPVVQVDRGGQVTYHGPGQIVAYPLIDLRRRELGVKALVCRIEEAILRVLAHYGVQAARRPGAPGIYVAEAKIASLGLRVRRGRSFHGLAFNINMDLEPFQRINPCGFAGLQVTDLSHFAPADLAEVEQLLVRQLADQLGFEHIKVATDGAWPA
ncbi:MAG TPA: lipoyl(octanoyl) transferase LipB [Xanthomonadales bacterium]|nr:lipoyl(octanoyl) transferase LipB [Xanthomonadales bacterium]